ncbi:MAG: ADP-glyceromanno-heptose 6-epimerase [Chitinivibrionales bacterium]|nr:ADP-glyceromanno-heptose 6-epimerase [Chitinivibrionales bacterium]
MIVVTGGAGFIGSVAVHELNRRGHSDIVVVDRLGTAEKWKNLVGLAYDDYLDKEDFIEKLVSNHFGNGIDLILHLGACSATTEHNADYLMENNYRYSLRIAQWRNEHKATRLVYASSAATYGDGRKGYSDDEAELDALRPLNMYGYSKHLFDLQARRRGWLSSIVGLKYFNVFGPNENHKGDMRSVINKAYPRVREHGVMSLFKSYRGDYRNGEQQRDFIYVKDAVAMTLYCAEHAQVNGIYNIGTGNARSWNDVAHALFKAAGREPKITYIDMPETIRDKYQYFTQANMDKLRSTGCDSTCSRLEDAIEDYVKTYLSKNALIAQC